MLVDNRQGNYRFLKGISPYSAGAAAIPGYEIERARLNPPLPLRQGFAAIEQQLKTAGRPRHALCALELRSPRPFSFQGFSEFNAGYVEILKSWDLLVDGLNPVARTNVALELASPPEPAVFAFSYTVPSHGAGSTFVIAGAGELPEGSLDPHDVVRRGETSEAALREKARFVMGLMEARLHGLGADWPSVTAADIYTVHDIHPFLAADVLAPMGQAARQGVTWHYARPPIVSIEYEMDMRGCRREIVIDTHS
jgi:hypothetical protein